MARLRDIEKFSRDLQRALKVLDKSINQKPKQLQEDLRDEALSVISRWYAQYDPHKYRRKMSLKKAFKIIRVGVDVSIDYDASYMEDYSHHQSNDIIFNNAFVEGYHGGSWGTDKNEVEVDSPHWRTPFLKYSHWDKKEAPQSFSPQEEIDKKSEALIEQYEKEWRHILNDEIITPLKTSYDRL